MTAPPGPHQPVPPVLDDVRKGRIWTILALLAAGVGVAADFTAITGLTRWWAWALIGVVAVFLLAGSLSRSWSTVAIATATAALIVGMVAVHLPDESGDEDVAAEVRKKEKSTNPAPEPLRRAINEQARAVVHDDGRWFLLDERGEVSVRDDEGKERFDFEVPAPAHDLIVCEDGLIVTYRDGWIGRYSLKTGDQLAHYEYGYGPGPLACGDRAVWVAKAKRGVVVRLDARTLALEWQLRVANAIVGIAYGDDVIWSADPDDDEVIGLNADTGEFITSFGVMDDLAALVFAERRLWAMHAEQSCLMRIDPALEAEVGPGIALGPLPRSVVVHDGVLYVIDYTDGSLRQIDVRTGEPVAPPVRLGEDLRLVDVAAYGGRVVSLDRAGDEAVVVSRKTLHAMEKTTKVEIRRSADCPKRGG